MTQDRYSRQELFSPIGKHGQERLRSSSILIVGCGALGAAHAESLARAGVGRLRIVDRDYVEFTNLQRQTLFSEADALERLPKAIAAEHRLNRINSDVLVEALVADVNNSNVEYLLDSIDIVLDGSDNFQVRYLLNDACVKHEKPWVYGAAVSSYGATMTIIPGSTPCLRCIFPEMPDAGTSATCDTAGVIMPIINSISAVQVTEALKLILRDHNALHRSLLQIDIWSNDRHRIALSGPVPGCRACELRQFEFLDSTGQNTSAVLCGRDAVQVAPQAGQRVDLEKLEDRLSHLFPTKRNQYLLRFVTNGREVTVFTDGRAIIKGTDDTAEARSIYDRYVGS